MVIFHSYVSLPEGSGWFQLQRVFRDAKVGDFDLRHVKCSDTA